MFSQITWLFLGYISIQNNFPKLHNLSSFLLNVTYEIHVDGTISGLEYLQMKSQLLVKAEAQGLRGFTGVFCVCLRMS